MSSKYNTSTSTLLANNVFNGQFEYIPTYQSVALLCNADVSGTLSLHFSNDSGSTTDHTEDFSVVGGTSFFRAVEKKGNWVKVVFTNGSVDQSSFTLRTQYRKDGVDADLDASDTVNAKQSGAWSLDVNNFPTTQAVSIADPVDTNATIQNATLAVTQSGAWTVANAVSTDYGSEGNLFNNVSASGTTTSSAIDVSNFGKANVLARGSDTSSINNYDILVSDDNTNYYRFKSLYLDAYDGGGNLMTTRQGVVDIDLHGINYLKLQVYDTETVNATLVGVAQ